MCTISRSFKGSGSWTQLNWTVRNHVSWEVTAEMSVYAALTMMGWGWELLASLITYVDGTLSFVSYSTDQL